MAGNKSKMAVVIYDENDNAQSGAAGLKMQQQDVTSITGTAAAGSGVTVTIPAPGAGIFNRLAYLQIVMYAAAAQTGGATPILVTTTGLPNNPVFTFPTALVIGAIQEEKYEGVLPMIASAAAATITIVCPATTGVIWRVNAAYYQA